jgi:hypothetical protein
LASSSHGRTRSRACVTLRASYSWVICLEVDRADCVSGIVSVAMILGGYSQVVLLLKRNERGGEIILGLPEQSVGEKAERLVKTPTVTEDRFAPTAGRPGIRDRIRELRRVRAETTPEAIVPVLVLDVDEDEGNKNPPDPGPARGDGRVRCRTHQGSFANCTNK